MDSQPDSVCGAVKGWFLRRCNAINSMGKKNKYKRRQGHKPPRLAQEAGAAPAANEAAAAADGKGGAAVFAAACGVFILSFFACLAGIADGTVDIAFIFGMDSPRPWLVLEFLLSGQYDLWGAKWSTANVVVDVATLWPLYLIFGYVTGGYVWIFLIAALSVAGWILLCNAVFGKNANRTALVVFLHALPFVYMAWFGNDVFYTILLPVLHLTAWASLPWLLWLGLRVAQGGGARFTAALGVFTAVSVFSDPVILPWFSASFVAALFLIYRKRAVIKKENRWNPADGKTAAIVIVAGSALGFLAGRAVPFAERIYGGRVYSKPTISHIFDTIVNLFDYAVLLASRNPLCLVAWLVFAVVAARFFMLSLPSSPAARSIPSERRLLFLFAPLAMAAAAGAIVASGLFPFLDVESFIAAGGFGDKRYMEFSPPERALGTTGRYLMPLLFLPLFAGWALYAPPLKARGVGLLLLFAAFAAAPRAAAVEWRNLNPYAHPFYECLHKAAQRLNAKSVIVPTYQREILAYPEWRWESWIIAGVLRGERGMVYSDGPHHRDMKHGPYDFVIPNASGGKYSLMSPGRREPFVCSYKDWARCVQRVHSAMVLDGKTIRAAFGEPKEVIQCPAGHAIFYYDPPIAVKKNKIFSPVSRKFDARGWTMPADY